MFLSETHHSEDVIGDSMSCEVVGVSSLASVTNSCSRGVTVDTFGLLSLIDCITYCSIDCPCNWYCRGFNCMRNASSRANFEKASFDTFPSLRTFEDNINK